MAVSEAVDPLIFQADPDIKNLVNFEETKNIAF